MTTQTIDRFRVADADPAYKYRWCNNRDLHMQDKIDQGWEPVHKKDSSTLPTGVAKAVGQQTETPAGGSLVTRGDLVLMRMRKDAFEERIATPKREARERQAASLDTLVAQANDTARQRLRDQGLRTIRPDMVFQTTDDANFPGQPPKED